MTYITHIQRYCIHDGPGVRTTVFFKGCPLNCRWCHNPENIGFSPQLMRYPERCTGCMKCAAVCPSGAIAKNDGRPALSHAKCAVCGACADACPNGAVEIAGRAMPPQDLARECKKDSMFFEASGGGVTLSGGEVMAQDTDYLAELLRLLAREQINVAIDTCGCAPWSAFEAVLPYTGLFLYDIKLMDNDRHRHFTGCGNGLILENLARLASSGARIYIRMPLIEGVNASDADIWAVADFLNKNNVRPEKICLLPYHSIGDGKLARLGEKKSDFPFAPPPEHRLLEICRLLERAGFSDIQIGG